MGASLRGLEDAGEQINAAIDRAQRFLTLASLVTVILAAVATAMASRRYALRHLNAIALLKSFGADPDVYSEQHADTAAAGDHRHGRDRFAGRVLRAMDPGVHGVRLFEISRCRRRPRAPGFSG